MFVSMKECLLLATPMTTPVIQTATIVVTSEKTCCIPTLQIVTQFAMFVNMKEQLQPITHIPILVTPLVTFVVQ